MLSLGTHTNLIKGLKMIEVKVIRFAGRTTVEGFVDGQSYISVSNHIDGIWSVGSSSVLPYNLEKSIQIVECYRQVMEEVSNLKLKLLKRGDRVVANNTAGFNKGARGTVEFVEPSGERIWVLRDNSSGPVFYGPSELDFE